jgi:hypothetical protein
VSDIFIEEIMRLPGVRETQGEILCERSFRIEDSELLHIHGRSTVHVLFGIATKSEAIARGLAHQHHFAPRNGTVQLRLRDEDQLGAALGLAKQS